MFDSELGAPWLSPASPCIDAGSTDPQYSDREDPGNPGFALWPSHGGLRNDIGYTGGPHAGTLEHLVGLRSPVVESPTQVQSIALLPAVPNPFNPVTRIPFWLDHNDHVKLRVYNLRGQQVRELLDQPMTAGEHQIQLNARGLASGVYFVQLATRAGVQQQKILLLK